MDNVSPEEPFRSPRSGPIIEHDEFIAPSRLLSPLNALLAGFTVPVLALACALGTYLTTQHSAAALLAQGYAPWPHSAFWPDLIKIPMPFIAPSSAIWCRYVPGQSLAYAFTTAPIIRASAAGVAFLLGGFTLLAGALRDSASRLTMLAIGFFLCVCGLAATVQSTPAGFAMDLTQGTLRTGLGSDAASYPLASITGFSFGIAAGRYSSLVYVYAAQNHSQAIDLVSLNGGADDYDLAGELQTFLATQGTRQ